MAWGWEKNHLLELVSTAPINVSSIDFFKNVFEIFWHCLVKGVLSSIFNPTGARMSHMLFEYPLLTQSPHLEADHYHVFLKCQSWVWFHFYYPHSYSNINLHLPWALLLCPKFFKNGEVEVTGNLKGKGVSFTMRGIQWHVLYWGYFCLEILNWSPASLTLSFLTVPSDLWSCIIQMVSFNYTPVKPNKKHFSGKHLDAWSI